MAVMGGLVAFGPLALYLIALSRDQFSDSGRMAPSLLFSALAVMLAIVFLPPIITVIANEPIRALDVTVLGVALFVSHVAAFVIGTQVSRFGLLAYPVGSAVATAILRSLAPPDDVEPAV